jgi:adenine-specific DNA-methyltransferase
MQHKLGQYFTTNHSLKDKVYEFILNNPDCILEPSIGQGDLVVYISNKLPNIIFDMYEIDNTIKLLDGVTNIVIYNDFIKSNISKKYKTIIGNPPYVKTKKGNLYIDFIEKCFNLLDNNGELIFIIPSDFFKLTSASNLLNEMMLNGSFTHIYHPHNEKLFENASIDVIIFRYVRGEICNRVLYNDQLLYIRNSDGLITFDTNASTENENENNILFKDYFDIYVGLVSGKDEVYKNNQLGNITVLNGENKYDKYIFSTSYPSENQEIDDYLLNHKTELLNRGIRKFNNNNWFEWGAPRNISVMKKYYNKDCIYVYNLTRKTSVAFVGKVTYFGGGLIMLLPKENINCNLNNIVSYINSDVYRRNFIFSGRFKIGHRQISNSFLNISLNNIRTFKIYKLKKCKYNIDKLLLEIQTNKSFF